MRDSPRIARDERGGDFSSTNMSWDTKPMRDGSFSREQLWRFMWDINDEPEWRDEAEKDNAYYDGDQLEQQTLVRMKESGINPVVMNMVAAAIDSVAGWEAITRADVICKPENDESYDVAMALNMKLKEAVRMTMFNQKVGAQFKQTVKQGLGWLEVIRNPDPYGYPYKVSSVPWREMYIDYRSREPDYSDARYILRRKWYDADELLQFFPSNENQKIIKMSMGGNWQEWAAAWEDVGTNDIAGNLGAHLDQERRFTLEEDEWRQIHRGRVRLYEILYSVPMKAETLVLKTGHVMQLDRSSLLHLQLLKEGEAQYRQGTTKQWRQAYYLGPHRMYDQPLARNKPHYIPMVGYRKDNDGSPYGLIRRMRSPQENINARYARGLYDLSSRKYYVDENAVDDHDATRRELNKVNSYITLKEERATEAGIRTELGTETTAFTFQFLQEAKQNLFDVTGLHPEFTGRVQTSGQSGAAIDQLIEQTTQVLGVIVDNYRQAKQQSAEQVMQLIIQDLQDQENVEVEMDKDASGVNRKVMINARRADGKMDNNVLMMRTRVALSEVPASATYMQQKFQSLTEIVKSMPPEMQGAMMDLVVRAAALPDQDELLERIRQISGFGPEPRDPQKRAELQQQQEQQEMLQQRMTELEIALQEAELRTKEAKAEYDEVRSEKMAGADTDLTEAKVVSEIAKARNEGVEQERKNVDTKAKLIGESAKLRKEQNAEATRKAAEKKAKEQKKKPATKK